MRPLTDLGDLVAEFANKLQISRDRLAIQTSSKGDERRGRARRRQARLALEFAELALKRYNGQEDTDPVEITPATIAAAAVEIQEAILKATAAELADDRRVLSELHKRREQGDQVDK